MGQAKDDMIPFMTRSEIDELIAELGEEIEADYEGEELVLICPLKGSFLFCADLSRKLDRPVEIDFVYRTRRPEGVRGACREKAPPSSHSSISSQHAQCRTPTEQPGQTPRRSRE